MQEYCEKVYNTKFNNLEEMDQYLEKYNLPRLNQEELENINISALWKWKQPPKPAKK